MDLDSGLYDQPEEALDYSIIVHSRRLRPMENASDCIVCGHCNSRCPCFVDQMTRMQEIVAYFGK